MNRRKVIIAVPALAACVVLAVVFWPEKPEPVYKGRKLSEWMMDMTSNMGLSAEAKEAVGAIGTNGIPLYWDWMLYKHGFVKRVRFRLGAVCDEWLHVNWYPQRSEEFRAFGARGALRFLREKAASSI